MDAEDLAAIGGVFGIGFAVGCGVSAWWQSENTGTVYFEWTVLAGVIVGFIALFLVLVTADSKECFIATAAYGTPMAEEIQTLRNWREEIMKSLVGKVFVFTYYRASPPIAFVISKSERLRAITRRMLRPIIERLERRRHGKS